MIYVTSDFHLFHDRKFIYEQRGFSSEEEMRGHYLSQWMDKVSDEDDVYMLGDFALGTDFDAIERIVRSLPGKKHFMVGNHDTERKVELYKSLGVDVKYADMFHYHGRMYYTAHYPTMTAHLDANPRKCIICLHGHEHVKERFFHDLPYVINVSPDASNNRIMTIDEIEALFYEKVEECAKFLGETKEDRSL